MRCAATACAPSCNLVHGRRSFRRPPLSPPPMQKTASRTLAVAQPTRDPVEERLTILCADDHTLVGDALVHVLTTAGYGVERATDGGEAWHKLSSQFGRFDVVIAAHGLRGLGGVQLASRLRDARYPGRIIVHGGALSDRNVSRYLALGVEAVVAERKDARKLLGVMKAFHRQD